MPSKRIESFRKHGLGVPVVVRPGFVHWSFFVGALVLAFGPCLIVLLDGGEEVDIDPIKWFVVVILGPLLFGPASFLYFFVLVRAGRSRYGLMSFSETGIYSFQFDKVIAWDDVGPAWSYTVSGHTDVLFVLRNASKYRKSLNGVKRLFFDLNQRQCRTKSGGAYDLGVKVLGTIVGGSGGGEDVVGVLKNARQRLQAEPDSTVLGLPRLLRFGLSNDETIEIINTVVAKREAG